MYYSLPQLPLCVSIQARPYRHRRLSTHKATAYLSSAVSRCRIATFTVVTDSHYLNARMDAISMITGPPPILSQARKPMRMTQRKHNCIPLLPRVAAAMRHRCFVSRTVASMEKKTINVPTMGDSITEGTIVEWTAQIGQKVHTDDTVALIETDKVTVEIKATMEGVITRQFGNVDDTVEVGKELYELDTEAEAMVKPNELQEASGFPVSSTDAATDSSASTTSLSSAEDNESSQSQPTHGRRIPSIHFLQKEGWAKRKNNPAVAHNTEDTSSAVVATATAAAVSSSTAVTATTVDLLPPMYGRPVLSPAEMEALMYGGANMLD